MIRVRDLTKHFGRKAALNGISFTLHPGEVLALLGHNGAGKTTTLRLITTLLDPTSGSIDRPANFKLQIGFLPDEPFLFDYLTGREMLHFTASLYRVSAEDIRRRTEFYLRMFELQKVADQLIVSYSRGMRRKISLIGSLLHDPIYWLLDEPTESLDPVAIRNLKDLIASRKREDKAVLISTHQLAIAEAVSDRLVVLNQGSIVFEGPLHALETPLEDFYLAISSAGS
ncbi:MAG: ABC transporter ATP-binding protein [Acidobacteriota bacterium]